MKRRLISPIRIAARGPWAARDLPDAPRCRPSGGRRMMSKPHGPCTKMERPDPRRRHRSAHAGNHVPAPRTPETTAARVRRIVAPGDPDGVAFPGKSRAVQRRHHKGCFLRDYGGSKRAPFRKLPGPIRGARNSRPRSEPPLTDRAPDMGRPSHIDLLWPAGHNISNCPSAVLSQIFTERHSRTAKTGTTK